MSPTNPTPAERVETKRIEHAEDVEATRVGLAEDVELTRRELAVILEADRKSHNTRIEEQIKAAARSAQQRFLFLFAAMFLIFSLLAYRTEVTSNALTEQQTMIEERFHAACLVRADRQMQANIGRETLIRLAMEGPNSPPESAARELMTKQLRDGLLLPVESCG